MCQLNTSSQISVARVSFLLSSEGNWQENKKHGQLYLKKGLYLDTRDQLIIYLEERNLFLLFCLEVRTNKFHYILFSLRRRLHCYVLLSFNSTFFLFLKMRKLLKEVNRRQVKPGVLNSPRPRLRGAQMVLFL